MALPQLNNKKAILYMGLLTLQFGMQPMLTAKFTPKTINRSTVIVVQEAIKFIFATSMLFLTNGVQSAMKDWSISSWVKVALIPAGLYTVQNTAALMAYQHLDGVTFNVLNQTKTLSAALCCYIIMGTKQSSMQMVALWMLLLSAMIIERILSLDSLYALLLIQGDREKGSRNIFSSTLMSTIPSTNTKHYTHGVLPVLLASFISGLAGAISQKNLQSNHQQGGSSGGGRNPYLFSAELCIASLLLLALSITMSSDGVRILEQGFFHEWTPGTLIPIITNSMGGIVVGLVTKYAGSVKKGFALIFGMLLTAVVQGTLEGGYVTMEEIIGGLVAALSLWIHATHPYVKPLAGKTKTD